MYTYTENDLIQFIYKETSMEESQRIAEAIQRDAELQEKFLELRDSSRKLPKVSFAPSKDSIRNILDYSSSTQLETC